MKIGKILKDDFKVWVPFMEDIEVQIRFLSMEETAEIVENATKVSIDDDKNRQEAFDVKEYNRLIGRAAVCDWKGMEEEDGTDIPFSPEKNDLLMAKWLDYAKLVNKTCTDIQALVSAEKAKMEKNSESTSS